MKNKLINILGLAVIVISCSPGTQHQAIKLGEKDVSIKGVLKEDLSLIDPNELARVKKWQHLDLQDDGIYGVSANKAYSHIESKAISEVIVAVIDSGVDIHHEDLAQNIWVNKDEIPDNGIDDDNNGYVDDIHGWNYIGGVDGRNLNFENLEEARVFKALKSKLESGQELSKEDFKTMNKAKDLMEAGLSKYQPLYEQALQDEQKLNRNKAFIKEKLGIEVNTIDDVVGIESEDEEILKAKTQLLSIWRMYSAGPVGLARVIEKAGYYVTIGYNPEYRGRADIVGDNPNDFTDTNYGNNNVKGPDSIHGTHVSGTIAAIRNNGLGMNGIASNVKIMALRAVPNGDERDKDIALAVRYAADNGAKIINMSFGKKFSPYKEQVDAAFEYAASKGVVFFHSAGNNSSDNDGGLTSFPNSYKKNGAGVLQVNTIKNWVEVGASTRNNDMGLAARFSNYGSESVTLFSPGHKIFATTPENTYKALSGTSMAAPVASGVAAMVMGLNPGLTGSELVKVLKTTVSKESTFPVNKPGDTFGLPVMFSALSETGGVINLDRAIENVDLVVK